MNGGPVATQRRATRSDSRRCSAFTSLETNRFGNRPVRAIVGNRAVHRWIGDFRCNVDDKVAIQLLDGGTAVSVGAARDKRTTRATASTCNLRLHPTGWSCPTLSDVIGTEFRKRSNFVCYLGTTTTRGSLSNRSRTGRATCMVSTKNTTRACRSTAMPLLSSRGFVES